jgi:hypothetical protein
MQNALPCLVPAIPGIAAERTIIADRGVPSQAPAGASVTHR